MRGQGAGAPTLLFHPEPVARGQMAFSIQIQRSEAKPEVLASVGGTNQHALSLYVLHNNIVPKTPFDRYD